MKGTFEPDSGTSLDSLAASEAAALASNEDLDADGKKKEHSRHQQFRDHTNKVALGLLWTVALFTLLGMGAFVFHLVMPASWYWLTPEALSTIKTLLTGVLFSSAMSGYVTKRMS